MHIWRFIANKIDAQSMSPSCELQKNSRFPIISPVIFIKLALTAFACV